MKQYSKRIPRSEWDKPGWCLVLRAFEEREADLTTALIEKRVVEAETAFRYFIGIRHLKKFEFRMIEEPQISERKRLVIIAARRV